LDHAADGGARRGRDVDRKPDAVRLERPVELVEHDAGSTTQRRPGPSTSRLVEVLRAVDDQRGCLTLWPDCEVRAASQHTLTFLLGDLDRPIASSIRRAPHAERHDLIVRGIGGVAAALEAVEHHLAGEPGLEPPFEPGTTVSFMKCCSLLPS